MCCKNSGIRAEMKALVIVHNFFVGVLFVVNVCVCVCVFQKRSRKWTKRTQSTYTTCVTYTTPCT